MHDLDQIISGNLTYEQASEHVRHHGRDDRPNRLMGLYRDVLAGDGLDESVLSEAAAFPHYEAFLAGCMASAWRLDDLARLASVAGHNLREDIERILPVLRGEEPLASLCKGRRECSFLARTVSRCSSPRARKRGGQDEPSLRT